MTKIFEKLPNAGKDSGGAEARELVIPARVRPSLPEIVEDKLLSLNRRIELLLVQGAGRVVEFAGTQTGHNTSRLVLEFAKLIARRLNKRVLLVTAGPLPYMRAGGNGNGSVKESWESVIREGHPIDDYIHPLEEGMSLWFSQMSASPATLPSIINDPRFDSLMYSLRNRFDVVVIDSPPLSESSCAARLSSVSDGVVLIVEAGKTRWQVIKSQMQEIRANNGTVLGAVLNNRRYYIPEFIYKRL